MNDSKFLSLNGLIYYDEKLKRHIKELYGSDMTVEWEPMEDGKNPFKLKIALKNGNGSEIFAKIVDFPLEQTIVSGSYERETKSLILYFQDGTTTKIPIDDLIEGLASKLDLDMKANIGVKQSHIAIDDVVTVPNDSAPYATVSKIGGMTRKCNNLLNIPKSGTETQKGLTLTYNGDGTFTINGTATEDAVFFYQSGYKLPKGDYFLKTNGTGMGWNSYFGGYSNQQTNEQDWDVGSGVKITSENNTFTLFLKVLSGKTLNNVVFKPMVNVGSTALPFEPYFSGLRDAKVTEIISSCGDRMSIPDELQNKEWYGMGVPNTEGYNSVDFTNGKAYIKAKKYVFTGDEPWMMENAPKPYFYLTVGEYGDVIANAVICNTYKQNTIGTSNENIGINVINSSGYNDARIIIRPEGNITSVAAWKNKLIELKMSNNHLTAIIGFTKIQTEDISHIITSDNLIGVEGGGTLTFVNEYGYSVPNDVVFYSNNNTIIPANVFVGNLKGVAESAEYYCENGKISERRIGDVLNSLLNAGSPLKITGSSLGELSRQQELKGVNASIIANPPVARGDIIIDKYLDGDASYLCFWVVSEVRGGSTDTVMDLYGAGNIYVGGGSASIADKAIADGNGNNIAITYAEKAYVQNLENEQNALANTVRGLQDSKADKFSLSGYSLKTDTGKTIKMSWEPSANGVNPYKLNLTLENESGDPLSAVQIDFPLEQMVVGAEYDEQSKSLILSTPDGQITVPVSDIFKGLVTDSNIINKKAGSAKQADYADVASSYKSADGSENTIESIWNRAVASGERANEAHALASEAKGLADSFDTSKASQNEVDALSQAQTDFENGIRDGTVQVHTAKYAPGNRTYTLENAIRNVTYSLGKLSFIRFNAESKEINLLTDDFISSIATALSQNTTFINLVVDAVMREMGYPVNN